MKSLRKSLITKKWHEETNGDWRNHATNQRVADK